MEKEKKKKVVIFLTLMMKIFLGREKLKELQRKKREKAVEINSKNIMEDLSILKKEMLNILK